MVAWIAAVFATLASSVPDAHGGAGATYLLDHAISREVDVSRFATGGDIQLLEGNTERCEVEVGPAPDPYPTIRIWEPDFGRLGASATATDGVQFFHFGKQWIRDHTVLVLWRIDVPNANELAHVEFADDVTLSLWVDWDQDGQWERNEMVIRRHVNLADAFPAHSASASCFYLTGFRVPELPRKSLQGQKSEIRPLWVRATITYDYPDASPDGEQLFGDVEDYRVGYRVTGKRP